MHVFYYAGHISGLRTIQSVPPPHTHTHTLSSKAGNRMQCKIQFTGRAVAKAVSRWPLTADARVRSRVSPYDFVVDKVALTEVLLRALRFSPVSSIPLVLHYTEKRKKLIFFITGLHNKPQGCGASVASAAGPFSTKTSTVYGDNMTSGHRLWPYACNFINKRNEVSVMSERVFWDYSLISTIDSSLITGIHTDKT
jgi:hypothetical protein